MRLILLLAPLTLAACAAPAPLAVPAGAAQVAAAGFDVPMDPGAIRCQSLGNPTALAAATEWSMGQARAGVLSGRTATLPEASSLSSNLARYCDANRQATVRAAAAQLGV